MGIGSPPFLLVLLWFSQNALPDLFYENQWGFFSGSLLFFLVVPFFHLIVAENKDLGKSVEIPKLPDGILWVWNFNWKGGGLTCNSLFLRKLICCCSAVISWKEVGVDWDTWSNVDDRIKWFKFLSSKFWFGKCN